MDSKKLIATLKKCLRSKGVTYSAVAKHLNLSESSVKRIFSQEDFTLERIERVCEVMQMRLFDLTKLSFEEKEEFSHQLSLEQETLLAKNPSCLAVFYLLTNGWSARQIMKRESLTEAVLESVLLKLDKHRIIELHSGLKIKVLVSSPVKWRDNGPVRKFYEKQILAELLAQSDPGSGLFEFLTAELSESSLKRLEQKSRSLFLEFKNLSAFDATLPKEETKSVAFMLLLRPWIFSLFSKQK